MKTCDIEGCTAPESQLIPRPRIGGIVHSCKYHLLFLKIVWRDKLLLDEGVIKRYYQTSRHVGVEYGIQEGGDKCQKEEKSKQTEV